MTISRCPWARTELDIAYHDLEWGVPVHDDRLLFEFLTLEGAQAGLSWSTILKKRANYRRAFVDFDPARVARFSPAKVERLLKDSGLVRNRLKIESTVSNARVFLDVQDEWAPSPPTSGVSWTATRCRTRWRRFARCPAARRQSDALSKDLKRRGFSFVGSTICYAFMQAVGMVNDHVTTCFRHAELRQ